MSAEWVVKAPWPSAPPEATLDSDDRRHSRNWRLVVENGALTIEVETVDGTGYGACSHSLGTVIPLDHIATLLGAHGWKVSQ